MLAANWLLVTGYSRPISTCCSRSSAAATSSRAEEAAAPTWGTSSKRLKDLQGPSRTFKLASCSAPPLFLDLTEAQLN